MLKKIGRPVVALTAIVVLAGLAATSGGSASAACTSESAAYSWHGTLPAYGIRDYSVDYCGPDTLDLYAAAHWKGNRAISLVLIAPDGTQRIYTGSRDIGGEVVGPLSSGTWTIVVRNNTSSNAQFDAEMNFKP